MSDVPWPTRGEYMVVGCPALALCMLAGNVMLAGLLIRVLRRLRARVGGLLPICPQARAGSGSLGFRSSAWTPFAWELVRHADAFATSMALGPFRKVAWDLCTRRGLLQPSGASQCTSMLPSSWSQVSVMYVLCHALAFHLRGGALWLARDKIQWQSCGA